VLLRLGWLLTPVVAWAVSFLGGWLGAALGTRIESDYGSTALLAGGALAGAVAGALGWIVIMRRFDRRVVMQ
jgi:hypothetical protein